MTLSSICNYLRWLPVPLSTKMDLSSAKKSCGSIMLANSIHCFQVKNNWADFSNPTPPPPPGGGSYDPPSAPLEQFPTHPF